MFGKMLPRQEAQFRVVFFGNVGVIKFKARDAQGVHIRHGLRGDAFEDALGQGLRVLEQAVDPRVFVGVEGEG